MTQTQIQTAPIRRTQNGSIDTAFYLARGRAERSASAWRLLTRMHKGLARMLRRPAEPITITTTASAAPQYERPVTPGGVFRKRGTAPPTRIRIHGRHPRLARTPFR